MRKATLFALLLLLLLVLSASRMMAPTRALTIVTTTSLYDTGLCDLLEEEFERRFGIDVRFIPLGSGLAMEYAKRGDADLVLTHAPRLERELLEGGHGVVRKVIAYNFFVMVGPSGDPAGIRGLPPIEAMKRVAEAGRGRGAIWISRGDRSGTHVREMELWRRAGFDPDFLEEQPWYHSTGAGMGQTLLTADNMGTYTLSDISTYLVYVQKKLISLDILVERGKELLNVYSVIAVNPKVHPHVNFEDAIKFIKFITSDEGQLLIASFRLAGETLFNPAVKLLREQPGSDTAVWIRELAFFNGTECPPQFRAGYDYLYE